MWHHDNRQILPLCTMSRIGDNRFDLHPVRGLVADRIHRIHFHVLQHRVIIAEQAQLAALGVKQIIGSGLFRLAGKDHNLGYVIIGRPQGDIALAELFFQKALDFCAPTVKPPRLVACCRVGNPGELIVILVRNHTANVVAFQAEDGFANHLHGLHIDLVDLAETVLVAGRIGHIRFIEEDGRIDLRAGEA